MRFEKKTDANIVIDHQTGLEWQAEAAERWMNWDNAVEYTEGLGNNWRLPDRSELFSLVNPEKSDPASDFPRMSFGPFWSSSVCDFHPNYAWFISFDAGILYYCNKNRGNCVRCVRQGVLLQ